MSLRTLTNAKSKSAWDTELDLLLFSLGAPALNQAMQTYGINVLKVREVARTPDITAAPQMPHAVEGMVSMRGRLVPVVNLATYFGIAVKAVPPTMIVAEYNGQIQGLLVDAVDRIVRLPWASVKKPPALLSPEAGSLVTAVGELADGRLVMMLDVEGILPTPTGGHSESTAQLQTLPVPVALPAPAGGRTVLLVDDSPASLKHTGNALNALQLRHVSAAHGGEAWELLQSAAETAQSKGLKASDQISAVLSDIEMPEMDGFTLTRRIKSDPRFEGIHIILHSSLSGTQIRDLAHRAGADEFVSKSEPQQLAETLRRLRAMSLDAPL